MGHDATGRCELNEFSLLPEAIYNCMQGWYEDEYVLVDNERLFQRRQVLFTRDSSKVTTSGPPQFELPGLIE